MFGIRPKFAQRYDFTGNPPFNSLFGSKTCLIHTQIGNRQNYNDKTRISSFLSHQLTTALQILIPDSGSFVTTARSYA
jgi:hypothetical protein